MFTNSNQFYEEVGIRIRDARNSAEIKQETLATQLGLSRASIINLEKGRHRPSLLLLVEIATVLMCDYTSLVPVNVFSSIPSKALSIDLSKSISSDPKTKSTEASVNKFIQSIK